MYSIDPESGACVNTGDCVNWAWCTAREGAILTANHSSLAYLSWVGPGPLNFTLDPVTQKFPVSLYPSLAPFVPLFAPTQAAVAALLDIYVSGQMASGGGGGNTVEYFTDSGAYWSTSSGGLDLYKSVLPQLYGTGYIQVLKSKVCARTWTAANGTCAVPTT
jgi:hypothetical protein